MSSRRAEAKSIPSIPQVSLIASLTALTFIPILAGCGSGVGESSASLVRDSAGVEIVENLAPAWGPGESWVVGSEATLRLGVVDGDPALQFNDVVGAGVLEGGSVVVADGGSKEIRFFDARGRHLRTTGRSGEGPGEFLDLSGSGVGPTGNVWAYDFPLRRLSWFDPRGELLGVTNLALDPPTLNALGPLPGGGFILKQLWGSGGSGERGLGLQRDPLAVTSFREDGSLADTVAVVPGREVYLFEENGRRVMSTPPFDRNPVGTIRGDRVVLGDESTYEVQEFSQDGQLLRVMRVPGRVEEVGAEDMDSYMQSRLASAPAEQHPTIRQALEEMPHSPTLPAYGDLLGDRSGNLWVGDWTPDGRGGRDWSVFDPRGRWLGEVRLPAGFSPTEIGEDWVLGVERDALDVEYVALYPLEKSARQ